MYLKITPKNISLTIGWATPLLILAVSFSGISYTTLKIALILIALSLFQFKNIFKLLDIQFLLLFSFLFVYVLIGLFQNNYKDIGYQLVMFPSLSYLIGKWFGSVASSEYVLRNGMLILALSLALFPIYVVLENVYEYGFSGGIRSIYIEQYDLALSATVMAGFLTFLVSQAGGLFSSGIAFRNIHYLFFKLSLVVILAVIIFRLGSRTQLAILAFCLYAGYLVSLSGKGNLNRISSFAVLLVLLVLGISYINSFSENSLISEYYQDRIGSGEYGVSSLGGRLERWKEAIASLYNSPGGWSLGYEGYAHNLWLDSARVSGILGLILLLLFTVASIISIRFKLKLISSPALKASVILGAISFLALFMVEPILDGYFYVFACYCAFLGMISGFRKNINSKNTI